MGYEPTPPGSFFEVDAVRGYYIDFRSKTSTPEAQAPDQLLPADVAQLALGWWDRGLAGESGAVDAFWRACRMLETAAEMHTHALWWPYRVSLRKYNIEPPAYSAMAQGQAASVFVRAYHASRDERHAEIAVAAVQPLLDAGDSGLVSNTPAGPVLEEIAGRPPSHILNGWVYALWGLRDVAVGLHHKPAQQLHDASLEALRLMIPEYDTGWWTRYSLYPHRLTDLAKPFYHRLHVDQMDVLHRLTGVEEFAQASRRWRSYDTAIRRTAAVAQKALFVATRYA
jgi:hypothetical protein